jgi:phage major head subunit gpT-like protein
MLITPANLSFFFTDLETRFWTAYRVAEEWSSKVSTVYNVGTEQWVSGWIGMLDTYREWVGPRKTHQPAPQTYLVPIKAWELTEEIDQFKLEDDQMGIYMPTVAFMGMQAKKLYDYKLRDLLFNQGAMTGPFQNGTDGLTNWNTAHPVNFWDASFGTYSNDYRGNSGTTVSPGGAFGTNAFNTLWEDHASRKGENGEALGITPDLSMFPVQLKAPAMTVLQSQFYAPPQMGVLGSGSGGNAPFVGAMDNVLRGWTDVLINVDLSAQPTTWFMLTTRAPIRPFSMLLRTAPDFVPRVTPDDPVVFDEHKILYGSRARFTPAWGLPWLSSISGP